MMPLTDVDVFKLLRIGHTQPLIYIFYIVIAESLQLACASVKL